MQNTDKNGDETRLIVLLIGMTMLAPFAIDAYLPAFPLMSAEFQVGQSGIHLTLAAFLLAQMIGGWLTALAGWRMIFWLLASATTVCFLFSAGFGLLGRWAIYLPGLMFMPLLHMVGANAITGAMEQFDSGKGAASALFLSLRFGAGILAVSIVGSLGDVSEMRYGLIVFVFAALSGVGAQMAVRWDEME